MCFALFAGLSIAPWVPARKRDLDRIDRLANLKPGQTFYELGCGDGRVCRHLARNNPQAKIIGIEIFFPIYLWAKLKEIIQGPKNMNIRFGNAHHTDLSHTDVIYTFAHPNTINKKLKIKFEQELKKGAKILSYAFSIDQWNGNTTTDKPNNKTAPIHIYTR